MKDFAIGTLGLSVDEYYSMTMGNFVRRSLGFIKNQWVTQREVIAAVYSAFGGKVTGEEIFPFGTAPPPAVPTEEDREYMKRRHENTLKLLHG